MGYYCPARARAATSLERRPHRVARQELHKVLWPGDFFVNFDQGLNSAIRKLRKALGDSTKNPCFIATQPHRGYRFVGHAIELHEVKRPPLRSKENQKCSQPKCVPSDWELFGCNGEQGNSCRTQ